VVRAEPGKPQRLLIGESRHVVVLLLGVGVQVEVVGMAPVLVAVPLAVQVAVSDQVALVSAMSLVARVGPVALMAQTVPQAEMPVGHAGFAVHPGHLLVQPEAHAHPVIQTLLGWQREPVTALSIKEESCTTNSRHSTRQPARRW
jgi:hypothetical protein